MAHILVVDDEPQLISIFEQYLTYDGHTVRTAGDGLTGVNLFTHDNFDLVITDIVMPEQDGFWVINELRKCKKTTRIIVMTGGAPRLDQQYLLKTAECFPVQKVLSKPVSHEHLRAAVTEVLALPCNHAESSNL